MIHNRAEPPGKKPSSPIPMVRSLSATAKKDVSKAPWTGDGEKPPFEQAPTDHFLTSTASSNSKFVPLTSAAPLNDAAASIVSLVNTAVPTLAKAFARKKGKDSACSLAEEDADAAGNGPSTDAAAPTDPKLKPTVSDGSNCAADEGHDVIMGVLSKWINIGRGWGPRLFVLEGGVLSYYKLDGPDKASVRAEMTKHRNPLLLGEEIKRWVQKEKEKEVEKGRPQSFSALVQQPLGTIHLLVASLRGSKSDEKKFYVYSGTKTLDLRAETHEDREQWLEILEAAQHRIDANMKELDEMEEARAAALATVREDGVERLLTRLRDAGLGEEQVKGFEESLREDLLGGLQERLKEEQRLRWQLQRRVKVLETEKVQLESAVVEETRNTLMSGPLQPIEDEDEDEVRSDGGEECPHGGAGANSGEAEEEDEGEDKFFEALSDFVESSSSRIDASHRYSVTTDMEKVGFDFPVVPRRTSLPTPAEKEKVVSLWSLIKDSVGKDISRVTLPVFFNEPISTLQKCAEELEYSWLLDRAWAYGQQGNELMRALHVAAFALSGYRCTEGRVQKPFTPLLGETFEADYPDKGWRFIAEKMEHNPNVVACHCEGQGWTFWGDSNLRVRFWGPSFQLDPLGVLSVRFDDGELFEYSKVTTGIYNLILGKLYIDHYGTMHIKSSRSGINVRLKFKERSIFDKNIYQVQGFAEDAQGRKLATLIGKWDEHLHFVMGDPATVSAQDEKTLLQQAQVLWRASPRSPNSGKYKFTPYCVTLNEITPGLREHLPPTDSRLRPDQQLLEMGRYDEANEEKLRLEERQRQARKSGEDGWHGRYFEKKGPHNTWTYNGTYWDKRAKKDWSDVKDLFAKPEPIKESVASEALAAA